MRVLDSIAKMQSHSRAGTFNHSSAQTDYQRLNVGKYHCRQRRRGEYRA